MIHHTDPELLNNVLQLLTEQGHDGFAEGLRILVNEAMRVERHQVLQAQPYERTDARLGYANGYKPKTLTSRVGPITFRVPQVRGETAFYPSALEKGIRSEQALKLAMAEMYVQGVSTRKVSAIVEELCGTSVSSAQVRQLPAFVSCSKTGPGKLKYRFLFSPKSCGQKRNRMDYPYGTSRLAQSRLQLHGTPWICGGNRGRPSLEDMPKFSI